ncbi:hypothetical protein [Nitrosopumilus sp.]|uniref:hypothetical protein n=1 Tax=Nitrosopumilus sp. TaxID=2024843 RepID=UPI00247EB4C7|nr:hypothetical protein [Nitrosopumilus sp.]MCV0431676.1 hypothetical protein [Nitrosopumilus sp.]
MSPAFEQSNSTLKNTQEFVSESKFLTNWLEVEHQGWKLPAIEEPHDWCGLWKTVGCNKVDVHEKLGKGRLTYVKQFRRSCYRAKCKSCYTNWIVRQANASTRRIETFEKKSNQKPIHLIFAVPVEQRHTPIKILRQRLSHILKLGNIHGASVIFHPFKFDKKTRRWYASPHFHLVGFGKSSDIQNAFGRYKWYIKETEERNSIFQTFCYLLSHCGIQKGYHAVTWFGSLSYSELPVDKEPRITKCPLCNGEFEEIYYEEPIHPIIPPDKHFEGAVEGEGWHKVFTVEYAEPTYEYAPTRDLDELLKGLAN